MPGLGSILSIAKGALAAQQYALNVISHNIANVNTPGYSRQTSILEPERPEPYAGLIFGRGVKIEEIIRYSDSFIETRLRERKTGFMAMNEKEIYMTVLEGIFNESSGLSLSAQFSDFWNAWQDLTNNPSGLPERNILYETSSLLAQGFMDLSANLYQFDREINLSIEAGLEKINQLTSNIATLNEQIISLEVTTNANDLRDQRNVTLSELSEYIDIKSFECDDGNLMVMTKGGCVLADRADIYKLNLDGDDINWEGSGGAWVTITDTIKGGKIGGWLDMRDAIIPKYKADLDELAKSTIWEVNKVHTQGVGLEGLDTVTGTYAVGAGNEGVPIGSSGLVFENFIVDDGAGGFKVWLYDENGVLVGGGPTTITINGATTMNSLAATITGIHINLTATVSNGKLQIAGSNNYTFAFSEDTSNVLAALGINTFFSGSNASNIEMNSILNSHKEWIAAARVDSSGEFATGDNTNALEITNLQYEELAIKRWNYERGSTATSQDVNNTIEAYLHTLVGSIGNQSQSIKMAREYSEVIVNQLTETRDSISAVNLDEEMTNLIKYQHAYTAAAKLISIADEMLATLLEVR